MIKRLHRLISYAWNTKDLVLVSKIADPLDTVRLALFSDADMAGDESSSKSTTGGMLALIGPNTFSPLDVMCKKQTGISHSTNEAQVIALDITVRSIAIPAIDFGDAVLHIYAPHIPTFGQSIDMGHAKSTTSKSQGASLSDIQN